MGSDLLFFHSATTDGRTTRHAACTACGHIRKQTKKPAD
jgi:hypothetical protein